MTESGSLSLAQALWNCVATQGQTNIVVPHSSPWYMAVDAYPQSRQTRGDGPARFRRLETQAR